MPKKKKKQTLSLKDLHKSTGKKWADDRDVVPSAPSGQHLITGEDQFPERKRATFGDDNSLRSRTDDREPLPPPRSDGDNNWRGSMGSRVSGRDDRGDGRTFGRGGYDDRGDGRGRGGYGGGYDDRDGGPRGGYGDRDGGRRGGFGSGYADRDGGRRGGYGDRDGGRRGYGDRDGYRDRDDGRRGGYGDRDGGRGFGRSSFGGGYDDRGGPRREGGFGDRDGFGSSRPQDDWDSRHSGGRPRLKLAARTKPLPKREIPAASEEKPAAAAPVPKPKSDPFGGARPINNEQIFAARKAAEAKAKAEKEASQPAAKQTADENPKPSAGRWVRRGTPGDDRSRRARPWGGSERDRGARDRDSPPRDRDYPRGGRERDSPPRGNDRFGRGSHQPQAMNSRWSMPERETFNEAPPRPVNSDRFARRNVSAQPQKKERDAEKERLLDEKMKALRGGSIKVETVKVVVQRKPVATSNGGKQRDPEKERLLDEKMKAMRLKAADAAKKNAEKPTASKPTAAKTGFRALAARKEDPIPLRVHSITAKDEEAYRALDKDTIAGYDKQIKSLMKEMYEDRNAGMMVLDDINSKIKHRSHYWQLAFTTMDIACEALRSQTGRAKEILRFLRCKTMDSRLMAKALNLFAEIMEDKKVDFPKAPEYFKEMVQYALSEGLVADIQLSSEKLRQFADLSPAGSIATTLWSGNLGATLKVPSDADPAVLLTTLLDFVAYNSLDVNDMVEPEEEGSETYVFTAVKDDQYGPMLKAVLNPVKDADKQYEFIKIMVAFAKQQGFPTIGDDDSLLQTLLYSFYDLEILDDMETAAIKWFEGAKAADAASTAVTQVNDLMESLMDDDDSDEDSDE